MIDVRSDAALGRSDVRVTRLSIGTNPLGNLYDAVTDAEAEAALADALAAGIGYFDTAPLYGYGLAEERLGQVLRGVPRESFVVSSKVGRLLREDAPRPPAGSVLMPSEEAPLFKQAGDRFPVFDFSYDGVMRSVEESLERLGLDRIDVLYIHDPDDHFEAAMSGAYPALAQLRDEKTVGAVGAGMNQTQMLARFAREGDFDCFLLAGRYTLLDQEALDDLLPCCLQRGISVVAAGVFNSGILADPDGQAKYDYGDAPAEIRARAQAIKAVCERHDVPLAAAAIQFPAHHPAVATVLLGVRDARELRQDIAYAEMVVPDDLWAELRAEGLIRALPGEGPDTVTAERGER